MESTNLEKRLAEICNGLVIRRDTLAGDKKCDTDFKNGRICEINAIRDEIIEAVGLAHCVECGFMIDD